MKKQRLRDFLPDILPFFVQAEKYLLMIILVNDMLYE